MNIDKNINDSQASTFPSNLKILIVEDDKLNQMVAKSFLKRIHLTADFANNGFEAINAINENSYDIVFMDVHMPELDGISATREIRKTISAEKLPIIALSATAMNEEIDLCLEVGMNSFLPKPINKDDFQEIIIKWAK